MYRVKPRGRKIFIEYEADEKWEGNARLDATNASEKRIYQWWSTQERKIAGNKRKNTM